MQEITIRRILVATDGTEGAVKAARYVAPVARAMNAQVTLLHVIPEVPAQGGTFGFAPETGESATVGGVDLAKTVWEGAQGILDTTRAPFDEAGVPVDGEVREGDAARAIMEMAESGRFDLLVIGSGEMASARGEGLGNTSSTLVREAPCPVLVVREM